MSISSVTSYNVVSTTTHTAVRNTNRVMTADPVIVQPDLPIRPAPVEPAASSYPIVAPPRAASSLEPELSKMNKGGY